METKHGQVLKDLILTNDIDITDLSKKIGYSRGHIYKLYEKEYLNKSLRDKIILTLGLKIDPFQKNDILDKKEYTNNINNAKPKTEVEKENEALKSENQALKNERDFYRELLKDLVKGESQKHARSKKGGTA